MKGKKILSILLCTALTVGGVSAFTGCSKSTNAFTIWITNDDSGEFYTNYNDNPVLQYVTENMTFNGKSISFEYSVAPVASKASENLSTMLATGDVSDIMDVSMATEAVADMYEDGIALDLTDYINEYMPHYKAWLDSHPVEANQIANYYDVDGDGTLDKRYFTLYSVADAPEDAFSGWLYRRDWIVKYGKNPSTGEAFTGGYNEDGTWTDDVKFPSWYSELGQDYKTAYADSYAKDWDGSDPIFISDWEWMFDIFNTALKDIGVGLNKDSKDGGYALSMYYQGFYPTGDLVSAFGGYENGGMVLKDDEAYSSVTSDCFREYMSVVNKWYSEGYIDKYFQTRTTSTLTWEVDNTSVYSGKVGMWLGLTSATGDTIKSDSYTGTKGAYVMACRNPINDKYSDYSDSAKYSEDNRFVPAAFFQSGLTGSKYIVTKTAEKKDLATLFTFLDECYNPDSDLCQRLSLGLTDEQIEVAKSKGYGEGVYESENISSMGSWNGDKTEFTFTDYLAKNDDLKGALRMKRMPQLMLNSKIKTSGSEAYVKAVKEAEIYSNTAYGKLDYLGDYVNNAEDRKKLNAIATDFNTFVKGQAYKFVIGGEDGLSVADDWQGFVNTIWSTKNFKYYIEYYTQLYSTYVKG